MQTQVLRVARKIRKGADPFVIGGYFFAVIYATLIIIPLYFVIVSAFKNNNQIILTPLALPAALNFSKFIQAQANVHLLRAGLISAGITTGAELLTLLLAFPAAYAVARIHTRLSTLVESIFSLGFLIRFRSFGAGFFLFFAFGFLGDAHFFRFGAGFGFFLQT